jgi:hypothetical protein
MDIEVACIFLGSVILFMLGFIVIVIGLTVINNILSKYWKPVQLFKWIYSPDEVKQVKSENKVS